MKSNTTFIFAGIMSVIVGNAYATGENIVTSKSYVDNALEQKQNKIEAYDENNDEYQSVLTDTTTDGVVGKKMILTAELNDGDPLEEWLDNDDAIPTVGAVNQTAQHKIYQEIAGLIPGQQNVTGMRAVLAPTDEYGEVNQIGLWDADGESAVSWEELINDQYGSSTTERQLVHQSIPTVGAVKAGLFVMRDEIQDQIDNLDIPDISNLQTKIDASAWVDGHNNTIPGVVISTDENGMVEQRMILDNVAQPIGSYAIANLVANGNDGNGGYGTVTDDIHDNSVTVADVNASIPTTTMTIAIANAAANAAANNATAALPWATAEQNATGAYSTTFANSGTNVWPTADADKVVKGTTFANAMATKQNKIAGYNPNNDEYQSLLTDTTTDGVVGKMEIMTAERNGDDPLSAWEGADDRIPTVGMVADTAQGKIPARATKIEDEDQSFAPSVVTNGTTDGDVGQMAILTAARVSGLDGEDGNEFANYTNADSLIPTAAAIRIELGYKANHMTCAGWPESVPVNQRTDANCWLWNKN